MTLPRMEQLDYMLLASLAKCLLFVVLYLCSVDPLCCLYVVQCFCNNFYTMPKISSDVFFLLILVNRSSAIPMQIPETHRGLILCIRSPRSVWRTVVSSLRVYIDILLTLNNSRCRIKMGQCVKVISSNRVCALLDVSSGRLMESFYGQPWIFFETILSSGDYRTIDLDGIFGKFPL